MALNNWDLTKEQKNKMNDEDGLKIDLAFDPKYSAVRVAGMLGVSKQTVYRLVAAHNLKCYRIGSSIRIGKSHIEQYLRISSGESVD